MSTETRPPDRLSSERDVELGSTSTDAFAEGQCEEDGPLAKYTQMGNAADEDKVSTLEKSCCIVTFVVLILLLLIPMVVYGITDLQEETRELNPKDLERWNVTTTPSTPITTKSWQEILREGLVVMASKVAKKTTTTTPPPSSSTDPPPMSIKSTPNS